MVLRGQALVLISDLEPAQLEVLIEHTIADALIDCPYKDGVLVNNGNLEINLNGRRFSLLPYCRQTGNY